MKREIVVTYDVDFDLSRDGRDIVLQLQGVGAFVRADARCDGQLRVRGLCHHGDTIVCGGQLLLSEGPLGDGGRVSGDGDSDGERLRDDHLQAVPEGAQVEGRTHCQERKMVQRGVELYCHLMERLNASVRIQRENRKAERQTEFWFYFSLASWLLIT